MNIIIDDAYQGEEAIEMVEKAQKEGFPYSLTYMDVRMPPGIDGVQAIDKIWKKYPNIEMVICSAYSDYSWDQILDKFGQTDKLLFVKKPFNIIVIKQLTLSLITKWDIALKNREYMVHLENEVDERTKELKRLLKEMTALKEKAEESDRLKSAFLSNMSHEIRTPMNSILGFSELLKESDLPHEKRIKYLNYISNSGEVLLKLINDIIYIAKIEAGVVQVDKKDFNLKQLLDDTYEIFSLQLIQNQKNNVSLKKDFRLDTKIAMIHSDPDRIKQIINNLLTNAIKFTKEGFIKLSCSLEENKQLRFVVEDSGIGIPKDRLDSIFKRFEQVENLMMTKNKSGTGLGLTISKNLAELLGGEMWVESVFDKGSTFYFTIPYEPSTKLEPPKAEQPEIKKKLASIENRTILIAEDEEFNFIFLQELLKSPDTTILWAKDGQEAVELFKNNNIDLILMDIRMPVMNGIEATLQIKKIKPSVPVIAQTAYALENEERKFREQGFDDYIKKPINIAELHKKIKSWIEK